MSSSGGSRAGASGGGSAGKPRCMRMGLSDAGSVRAAPGILPPAALVHPVRQGDEAHVGAAVALLFDQGGHSSPLGRSIKNDEGARSLDSSDRGGPSPKPTPTQEPRGMRKTRLDAFRGWAAKNCTIDASRSTSSGAFRCSTLGSVVRMSRSGHDLVTVDLRIHATGHSARRRNVSLCRKI